MDQKNDNAAFYFFVYLVMFLSLSFLATGVGAILFQLINKYVEDPLASASDIFSAGGPIKYGIASVLIAGPLFFFLSGLISRHLEKGKLAESSKVRKWLTYIILFIAAGTIIGDLITLVFNLLEGAIVLRFILKVLTVLGIAGAIFGYYFWDMRKTNMRGVKYHGNAVWSSVTIMLTTIAFVSAFFVADSPMVARDKKFDRELSSYLNDIQYDIESYYQNHDALPAAIDDLDIRTYGPDMRKFMAYQKTGDTTYKLCGDFKRSNLDENDRSNEYYGMSQEWKHDKGSYCFTRNVDTNSDNVIRTSPVLPAQPMH